MNNMEQLNELPQGWKWVRLGDVCLFENGDRGENYPSKAIQTTTGIPFINAGHLVNYGIDFEKMNYIPRERFNLLGNGKIRKNDILFCLRGSLGKFANVGELSEGAIASSLVIVRPKECVLNEFVLAYFQSDLCIKMIDDLKNGAAQPNLSLDSLRKFTIPFPPFSEQQRLATLLTAKLALIEQAKEKITAQLQAAQELTAAYLREVFESEEAKGWELKKLQEIAKTSSGTTPSRDNKSYYIGSIAWVKTGELVDSIIYDTEEHINETALKETSLKLLPKNTLLIAMYGQGQTRGRTGLLAIPATINQACFAILPNPEIFDSFYIQYWFRYKYQSLRNETEGRGGNQSNLNGYILNNQIIPIPSPEKQTQLANYLTEKLATVEQLKTTLQTQLDSINQLPAALLKQAFSGQL